VRPVTNVIFDLGGVVVRWNPDEILRNFCTDRELPLRTPCAGDGGIATHPAIFNHIAGGSTWRRKTPSSATISWPTLKVPDASASIPYFSRMPPNAGRH
jgi:hypothetical protein